MIVKVRLLLTINPKLLVALTYYQKKLVNDGFLRDIDPEQMCKAVLFCQHIKTSKVIIYNFNIYSTTYKYNLLKRETTENVVVNVKHIDGAMSAT
jgi:predicted helicase